MYQIISNYLERILLIIVLKDIRINGRSNKKPPEGGLVVYGTTRMEALWAKDI